MILFKEFAETQEKKLGLNINDHLPDELIEAIDSGIERVTNMLEPFAFMQILTVCGVLDDFNVNNKKRTVSYSLSENITTYLQNKNVNSLLLMNNGVLVVGCLPRMGIRKLVATSLYKLTESIRDSQYIYKDAFLKEGSFEQRTQYAMTKLIIENQKNN